jgi:inorganic pyrophosphatase
MARDGAGATVEAVVEIPKGSRNKCEVDHATGTIRLDRVLFAPIHYPTDYGFIPGTQAADEYPIDVLILVEEPTFPGCHIMIRLLGVLHMRDEHGPDDKLLGIPVGEPRFEGIADLGVLPQHRLVDIEHFFATSKQLEGKTSVVPAGVVGKPPWRRCGSPRGLHLHRLPEYACTRYLSPSPCGATAIDG